MMTEQDKFIRECLDLSDRYTCQYVASIMESGKEDQLLGALSSAMYEKIVSKVDEIDFGTIPLSRGDITKVEKWDQTEECLDIMRRLVVQYKQNPAIIDVVITAASNVKDRKSEFVKAYTVNAEFPMLLYNLIVLAIERSLSLMIATCIQFVKDPSSSTPMQALDKVAYQKTMDDLMFKQLVSFNNQCANGTLDKVIREVLKKNSPKLESFDMEMDVVTPVQEPNATATNPVDGDDPFSTDTDPSTDEAPADNTDINPDELPGQPGEFSEEVPQDSPLESPADDVEPENIPPVVPGDAVTPDDAPINELEIKEDFAQNTANANPYITKAITSMIQHPKRSLAIGIAIAAVVGHALHLDRGFLDFLRNLIYSHCYTKLKFKEFLEVQAALLEANADDLEDSMDTDDKHTEKVIKRQRKFAEFLRKWANKFAIDSKESSNNAKKEAEKDKKEKKKIKKNDEGDDVLF